MTCDLSELEKTLDILHDHAALLKKTLINIKKCPKVRLTKGYIQSRLNVVEDYWQNYKRTYQDLIKCTTRDQREKIPYFVNDEFFTNEDLYLCISGDLKDMIDEAVKSQSDISHDQQLTVPESKPHSTRFPHIQLPTFTGKYEDWPEFMDLFVSLVHNTDLTNVQKLHYLKTSVKSEAASLIKNLPTTNTNYTIAWNKLCKRFGNKRSIVNSLLKRLYYQKRCTTQSPTQVKALLDTTSEILTSLQALEVSTSTWDPFIVFLVVQKLDPETHKEWEKESYKDSNTLSTWQDLTVFLEARFHSLEAVSSSSTTYNNPTKGKERVFHMNMSADFSAKPCPLCNETHTLFKCKSFTKLNPVERGEYIKNNKRCFNCLAPGHSAPKCRSSVSCHTCKRRHHTLLHRNNSQPLPAATTDSLSLATSPSKQVGVEDQQVHTMISSYFNIRQKVAFLATALVTIRSEQGHTTILKALIDSGSQACFISEKATQILNLKRIPIDLQVSGMESIKITVKHQVHFQLLSQWDPSFSLQVQAYVMSKHLSTNIPSQASIEDLWPHLKGLQLADPSFYEPSTLDLLLGVNEYMAILQQGLIKGPPGTPSAQNTHLGWIIMGGVDTTLNKKVQSLTVIKHEINMDELLKTIWEVDTDCRRKYTKKEKLCEEIYARTHTRNEMGRYIVKLPFKVDVPRSPEGNTKEIAHRRFLQLERKLNQNSELKKNYTEVINEYIALNHLEEVPEKEREKKSVYLPHHAVIRSDKESTKTRVVFDASCKGTNGVSLNDELLLGPVLQGDIRSLIMRWRTHAICFAADIQRMYRMISVDKEDVNYQRILWRSDPNNDIKEFRLLTVTFGTACAPYLAIKTLFQLAEDEGNQYPAAAQVLREDFYVDDLMSGCDTENEAIKISHDLIQLLHQGGFELKKWASNSKRFIKSIPQCDRSLKVHIDLSVDGVIKALGIQWNLRSDQFEYNLNLPDVHGPVTKRSILADIQKLFDPLGWIAPCIVMAKIFIQKLWKLKIGWDEPLDITLTEEWMRIRSDLQNICGISIDRWMGTTNNNKENVEIHGFSDASSKAYGAAAYCRVKNAEGTYKCTLIAARTKVAPLKTISVPRLELCGALLLARLLKQISQALRIPTSQVYAWTDSSIVMAWLHGDPSKWKTFVANRTVEITSTINSSQWHHVQSNDNPADISSRGMLIADLKQCNLWWQGPYWLNKESTFIKPEIFDTEQERKPLSIQTFTTHEIEERSLESQFEDFNTLNELLRILTLCRRFLQQKLKKDIYSPLTTEELEGTLKICIRLSQEREFMEDIQSLQKTKKVKTSSKLKSLDPYLDNKNILRVGGRLRNSNLDEETKHPVILGRASKLTLLLIAEAHTKTMHGGVELMLTYLRAKYWILRGKALVKQYIHKCLTCAKHNAKTRSQVMGDLPSVRVTPARAFLHSGVDFAGPFQVLMTKGRGSKTHKAYIAIFVCMSTKATHLELVGDLTAAAFIGAFKRFCSRRGRCTHLWSDQGRNFVAANKELVDAWKEAKLKFCGDIADSLANDGTQWHFIPAYSPNFGGLWEAGVKSMKHHMKRVLNAHLTFEEMTTVLCEIEACLNSRPLCPGESSDEPPLTPGHFLIGEAPITIPSTDLKNVKISNLSRWQFTQKLLHDFWSRWQSEYLTRLQQRPKWQRREEEFAIGDIVLIKQDGLPPGKWSLGRITQKHPGPDGMTRVYSVKSGDHITKRCISKLCAMPIDSK